MVRRKGNWRESHLERVNDYFGDERNYPEENAVIKVRARTLEHFTGGKIFDQVLDVACGDGKVAYRILDRSKQMTLVDLSKCMIERARANLPREGTEKASFLQGDILEAKLPQHHYDLVICTGLMAHIRKPAELIQFLSSLIKDEGLLFIQHTDSRHWYSIMISAYRRVLSVLRKEAYPLNAISKRRFLLWCGENGLKVEQHYRSMVSFMFLGPILKESLKYRLINLFFGDATKKKRQYCGHDYLFLMRKDKEEADE